MTDKRQSKFLLQQKSRSKNMIPLNFITDLQQVAVKQKKVLKSGPAPAIHLLQRS